MLIDYWSGNLREIDHVEDLDIDGSVRLECILKKFRRLSWTALIWLRYGTYGQLGLL